MNLPSKYRPLVMLLATTLAIAGIPQASATLQIYKLKGNVTVRKGKQNVKAQRRDIVAKTDVLTIPKEGKAEILDTDSRRIYSSKDCGEMTVKALMEKAEAQAADITRNINRKVIAAVADNADATRHAYEAMGMAIHETDAVVGPPVVIPEGMSYLGYLITNSNDPDRLHQCNIALSLAPTDPDEEGGPFRFKLENSTKKTLYFNVIEKGEGKGLSLLLPQNTVAAPQDETEATEYTFVADRATTGFIAVASDKDFTSDDVWRLLDTESEPEDSYFLTVLTLE